MTWKLLMLPLAVLVTAAIGTTFSGHAGSNFDRRIAVGAGGSIRVDIALGGGLSFDHGSLRIHSHDADDVRVLADTSGWGKYAVALDLAHEGNRVELNGRVDGLLDWLFGGPSVDVTVWLPADFSIDASIRGGPLLLEDLTGPITARVDHDVTLRRAEGRVQLSSERGSIEVEDVDGPLEVRSERGEIEITGVRGELRVATTRGSVAIESVTGKVDVEADAAGVEIEGVRGDVKITTGRGRIEADDIAGLLILRTTRGGIEISDVDGEVRAVSERGGINVAFKGRPHGEIETTRGTIEIEVPEGAGFDLDARTERGRVSLDGDDSDSEDRRHGEGWRSREQTLVRAVEGGGSPLRLRTGRGSIHVHH